jgi:hypothetical protein
MPVAVICLRRMEFLKRQKLFKLPQPKQHENDKPKAKEEKNGRSEQHQTPNIRINLWGFHLIGKKMFLSLN